VYGDVVKKSGLNRPKDHRTRPQTPIANGAPRMMASTDRWITLGRTTNMPRAIAANRSRTPSHRISERPHGFVLMHPTGRRARLTSPQCHRLRKSRGQGLGARQSDFARAAFPEDRKSSMCLLLNVMAAPVRTARIQPSGRIEDYVIGRRLRILMHKRLPRDMTAIAESPPD